MQIANAFSSRAWLRIVASGLVLAAFAVSAGCSSVTPEPSDGGDRADAGPRDAVVDGSPDGCTPSVCDATACGTIDDGCGGTLSCTGGCVCDPDALEETCPERACEVLVGCDDAGACAYEPVTCSFEQCVCPEGATCSDQDLRVCGETCGTEVCDPQPTTVGGVTHFANACVAIAEVTCGTCGLGQAFCDADALACSAPSVPGVFPETANCDGASPTASVVYFDPAYSGVGADGSEARPFVELDAAVAAATLRGARAIVIGGAPRLVRPLEVVSQLSFIGGYTGWPSWLASSARPTFVATLSDTQLAGLVARGIDEPTLIQHVAVETLDRTGTDGSNNAGAYVVDSPALILRDVTFVVGAAADGADGAPSVPSTTVGAPGSAAPTPSAFSCPTTVPAAYREVVAAGGAGGGSCGGASTGGAGGEVLATGGSGAPRIEPQSGRAASDGAVGGGARARGADGAAWSAPAADAPDATIASLVTGTGDADFPRAAGTGADGANGAPGHAGGGGGSSGTATWCSFSVLEYGGGGGGGGGCGGPGGRGGSPAGWSLGLVVVRSDGVTFESVRVSLGEPGNGGDGAAGAVGTSGGAGGSGSGPSGFASGAGGNGSAGQTGGRGGDGTDGLRGLVYWCGEGEVDLTAITVDGTAVDRDVTRCP